MEFSKKDVQKGLILPRSITLELAYLIGVFVGDGSINVRLSKKEYLIKCVGNPRDEKELYNGVVGPLFKKVFGFIPDIRLKDSNTTYGFVVYSKSLVSYLTNVIGLPIGQKYDKLSVLPSITSNDKFIVSFLRGLFDTDGCITFKKRYRDYPYYPVISFSSKSKTLVKEVSHILNSYGFNIVEYYDYKVKDKRIIKGFTIINRVELNGKDNLELWMKTIGFLSPKHIAKIEKYGKNSGRRI